MRIAGRSPVRNRVRNALVTARRVSLRGRPQPLKERPQVSIS